MFKLLLALLVIVCIALAATNPNEEAHKKAFYANRPNEAGEKAIWRQLVGIVMENTDALPLEYHNNFFYSTMTLRDKTVSYGLLDQIWAGEWVESVKKEVESMKKEWVPTGVGEQ